MYMMQVVVIGMCHGARVITEYGRGMYAFNMSKELFVCIDVGLCLHHVLKFYAILSTFKSSVYNFSLELRLVRSHTYVQKRG